MKNSWSVHHHHAGGGAKKRFRLAALAALSCGASACADVALPAAAHPTPVAAADARPETCGDMCCRRAGPDPLYIVDGRRLSREELARINPGDIVEVFFREGADAVAEFGAEAARGVALISTRQAVRR